MKVLFFVLLLFPGGLLAQTFPVDALSGKIYYAEEVLVKDGPTLDLYYRAKAWFAAQPNKTKWQVDDVANGLLIGTNFRELKIHNGPNAQTCRLWYTVKLEMEDDRYWYSLTDFRWQHLTQPDTGKTPSQVKTIPLENMVLPANPSHPKATQALPQAVHRSIQDLIKTLKRSML